MRVACTSLLEDAILLEDVHANSVLQLAALSATACNAAGMEAQVNYSQAAVAEPEGAGCCWGAQVGFFLLACARALRVHGVMMMARQLIAACGAPSTSRHTRWLAYFDQESSMEHSWRGRSHSLTTSPDSPLHSPSRAYRDGWLSVSHPHCCCCHPRFSLVPSTPSCAALLPPPPAHWQRQWQQQQQQQTAEEHPCIASDVCRLQWTCIGTPHH